MGRGPWHSSSLESTFCLQIPGLALIGLGIMIVAFDLRAGESERECFATALAAARLRIGGDDRREERHGNNQD
jgi:hypothetical protein